MDKIFDAIVVATCLVLLVRLGLGAHRRHRFDRTMVGLSRGAGARLDSLFTWNSKQHRARRAADAAIRRARDGAGKRDGGEWDGNVYRPKSFTDKKKGRNLH